MAENNDNKDRILSTLGDIETSGCDVLLQQLFVQLKVRHQRVGFNGRESGDMSLCHPNLWSVQKGSGPGHTSASLLTWAAARKPIMTSP